MTLQELSTQMARIDFAMLSTRSENGSIASRPMSNNGDVEYRGDSYFFTREDSGTVIDIEADDQVALTFTASAGPSDGPALFIAMQGEARLIRDKAQFREHWNASLDRWFEQGADTPGIVLIHVQAERIHYWNGMDEGEVLL